MQLQFDSVRKIVGPAHCIMMEYCDRYGITFDDMRGPSRQQPLAQVRQDCMAEIYHKTNLSTVAIGKLLNRDHTTVMHGIRRSKQRQGVNP